MKRFCYWLFLMFVPLSLAQKAPSNKAKKGPVVDLGTLDIEGEARQPNLQYIEGPAIRDQLLKKVFTKALVKTESDLLQPARRADFPELKGKFKK